MNPDYSHLYLELDLQPSCGIDELRQAYRRHVANRHPDRSDAGAQDSGRLPLPVINALYHEALRFHLRYGRLPGASQPRAPAAAGPASPDAPGVPGGEGDVDTAAASRLWWWLLLVAAIVAGSMLFGSRDTSSTGPGALSAAPVPDSPDAPLQAMPDSLALGMDIDTVLAIQGEPVHRNDGHWDYGPSWLRFERGKLVDWYSSRLSPLRTATTSPPPESLETVDLR